MRRFAFSVILLSLAGSHLVAEPVSADPVVDALKTPGHVALMRHAIAPGSGDPDNFSLRDCGTQRNLSDTGRAQATDTGRFLRQQKIEKMAVFSSQWCRCLETARLLGFGDVTELSFLNSFYQDWSNQLPDTKTLKNWITTRQSDIPAILVTHQVNITALTNIVPASGEIVVVRIGADGGVEAVGTFELPE